MSVSDNIAYGLPNKDVSHEVIVEAAKAANAHDFIVSLPEVRIEAYKPIQQSEPEIKCHSWTLMNNTSVPRGYTALTLLIQVLVKEQEFTDILVALQGYNTMVGERGSLLSGGQRQVCNFCFSGTALC